MVTRRASNSKGRWPWRERTELLPVWKYDPVSMQKQTRCLRTAVLPIAIERKSSGRQLYPDLMCAPRVQAYKQKTCLVMPMHGNRAGQDSGKGFLSACPLCHPHGFFPLVWACLFYTFFQKVFHNKGGDAGPCSGHPGQILFNQSTLLSFRSQEFVYFTLGGMCSACQQQARGFFVQAVGRSRNIRRPGKKIRKLLGSTVNQT